MTSQELLAISGRIETLHRETASLRDQLDLNGPLGNTRCLLDETADCLYRALRGELLERLGEAVRREAETPTT